MAVSLIRITPLALLRTVGGGDVTDLVVVVTVRVDCTLYVAGVGVDAVEVCGAVCVGTLGLTVVIVTTLRLGIHLIANNVAAVNIAGPVTHRAIRILVALIEHESPSSLTHAVLTDSMLTISALHKAGFSSWAALPESAAVCGVFMVVRPLGDGINELGTVWDHTAIIGETLLTGVVGHSVVLSRGLGSDKTDQQEQLPGSHGLCWT